MVGDVQILESGEESKHVAYGKWDINIPLHQSNILHSSMEKALHFDEQISLFEKLPHNTNLLNPCTEAAYKNYTKNRYSTVLPFDYNRVKLEHHCCCSDYINASFVADKRFISTQAPVPTSFVDFWLMVWEQKSPMIVMLTSLIEGPKTKAHLYWPTVENKPHLFGHGLVRVTMTSQQHYSYVDIRTFEVEVLVDGVLSPPHTVQHFQYTQWPDFGVPKSTAGIRDLMDRAQAVTDQGPIIVHCSAGIGRSGTFIAALLLDDQLKKGTPLVQLDLVKVIEGLRVCRTGMIQTKSQFNFLYELLCDRETQN